MRCSERDTEWSCAAWLLGLAALLLPRTAALTDTCAKKGGEERQGGEEIAVVLTATPTAMVSLHAAQLSAARTVRRSVGELPLRVLV